MNVHETFIISCFAYSVRSYKLYSKFPNLWHSNYEPSRKDDVTERNNGENYNYDIEIATNVSADKHGI